jgi:hypothetical protein
LIWLLNNALIDKYHTKSIDNDWNSIVLISTKQADKMLIGGIEMKHADASNCRDPENRSKKACVCGGHSFKVKNAARKKQKRRDLRRLCVMILTGTLLWGCASTTKSAIEDLASYGADLDTTIKADEIKIQIEGMPAPIYAKNLDIKLKLRLGRYYGVPAITFDVPPELAE